MAIAIKKQWLYLERDEEKRKEYNEYLEKIPIELRLYFDESGFDLNMIKEYGYELTFKRLYHFNLKIEHLSKYF